MKKSFVSVAIAIMISVSVLFSSCIGSFGLTKKVYDFNTGVGDKFVNELVFLALNIVPVYQVAVFIDAILLNSIEFWTGNSPLAAGDVKNIQGEGDNFQVETLADGYKIQNSTGAEIELKFDNETDVWSVVVGDMSSKLLKVLDKDNAVVYLSGGEELNVSMTEAGMLAFRQAVDNMNLVAVK